MDFPDYFQPYEGYFWRIQEEDSTSVFVLPGGGTIVYSQLLMRMLEDLAGQGLPPLGALLLVIIATNHSPEDQIQLVEEQMRSLLGGWEAGDMMRMNTTIEEGTNFMHTLAALPMKYTSGSQRIQLFQLLFSNSHTQMTSSVSAKLVAAAGSYIDQRWKISGLPAAIHITRSRFAKDMRSIALLGRRFPDEKTIVERLAAMPELSEAPALEESEVVHSADLVDALIEHPLTFQVGTLIKPIWSGLNIPIHHQLPGDQPLGGFSDLSNKGDFDKLLISEFAHDEFVLLSRLANNEALFLRREIAPGVDDLQRVLLLDVSLKSWGNPRILSFAVMLAIARHPRTDIHSIAFAIGEHVYPMSFETVDEVIASLQLLEGCLHPAEGLVEFFDRQTARSKLEIIFIATADTLANRAVMKVISDHFSAFRYWVEVGREGEIDLYRNQSNSRRLIQQMRLPMESLWKGYKRDPSIRVKMAAIPPGKASAPLLYPASTFKITMVAEDMEVYYIDKLGKLFRLWQDANKTKVLGFELLFEGLPDIATHFQIGKDLQSGHLLLLCYTPNPWKMTQFDIETGHSAEIELHGRNGRIEDTFFFSKGAFYFQSRQDYFKISGGIATSFDSTHRVDQDKYNTGLKQHRYRMEQAARLHRHNKNTILRNLTRVGINKAGNLVFNKHELVCRNSDHIVLAKWAKDMTDGDMICTASWDEAFGAFVFPWGNSVRIDRSGMLVLEWREQQPAVLDVLLKESGANKISVARVIKEAGSSLYDAKKIIDAGHGKVATRVGLNTAVQLRDRLMNSGATAEVVPSLSEVYLPAALDVSIGVATGDEFAGNPYYYYQPKDWQITIIGPSQFFKKNIQPFIQDICNGANGKALL